MNRDPIWAALVELIACEDQLELAKSMNPKQRGEPGRRRKGLLEDCKLRFPPAWNAARVIIESIKQEIK